MSDKHKKQLFKYPPDVCEKNKLIKETSALSRFKQYYNTQNSPGHFAPQVPAALWIVSEDVSQLQVQVSSHLWETEGS